MVEPPTTTTINNNNNNNITTTTTNNNNTRTDQDGLRRPPSFAERIRNADNMQGLNRDSQLWSYSNPGVRRVR